jgi:hypothetical protein
MINVLKKAVKKMEIEKKDTEELRNLAKIFKQITDILNEVVDISDKLENNTLEISEEEANEKIEELLGRFIIQLLKINKKIGE